MPSAPGHPGRRPRPGESRSSASAAGCPRISLRKRTNRFVRWLGALRRPQTAPFLADRGERLPRACKASHAWNRKNGRLCPRPPAARVSRIGHTFTRREAVLLADRGSVNTPASLHSECQPPGRTTRHGRSVWEINRLACAFTVRYRGVLRPVDTSCQRRDVTLANPGGPFPSAARRALGRGKLHPRQIVGRYGRQRPTYAVPQATVVRHREIRAEEIRRRFQTVLDVDAAGESRPSTGPGASSRRMHAWPIFATLRER